MQYFILAWRARGPPHMVLYKRSTKYGSAHDIDLLPVCRMHQSSSETTGQISLEPFTRTDQKENNRSINPWCPRSSDSRAFNGTMYTKVP